MSLSQTVISQLQAYKDAGNAAGYYSTLAANGHDYGNLAYEAATDTGFWGQYANNFLENKAQELGVPLDRNKIMQELMQADFSARDKRQWEPIPANEIRDYHHEVFDTNGLPPSAWTGTFFDDRAGPAAWCIGCNGTERQGESWQDAVKNFIEQAANDWAGTSDQFAEFATDALGDGVFSETMADYNVDATGSIEWGGVVKALYQTAAMSAQGWLNIATWVNAAFTAAQRQVPRRDPLTLDLNGNGLETVPINAANPVYFDLTGEGVQTSVGWVAPNDGFLVLDRNGNGSIDDGTELFGDATPAYEAGTTNPSTGSGRTVDGFEALAQEDTNGDGVVNSADANFANLRVWQDANQDGISQAGELKTLAELGIESFNIANVAHSQLLANGNQIADTGSYTRTDGSTGTAGVTAGMADVNLAVDTFHRTFTDVIPTTVDTATLPDMQGSGVVRDLREAASITTTEGATLASALGQFAATTTRNEQRAQLDTLIADWGATSGFEDMQTKAAAHGYTLASNLSAEWQHKLTVLETFNGRGFYHMPWETTNAQSGVTGMSVTGSHISINMNGTQLALLDQAYSALKESVYDALIVQTRLKPYLDDISLTLTGTGIALDFTALDTRLTTTHTGNANTSIGDLLDLRRLMGDTLEGAGWDVLSNGTAANDAVFEARMVG